MNTLRYFDFGAARPVLLLIARIAVVLIFIIFGFPKMMGFDGTVQYMASLGAPMPMLAAIIARRDINRAWLFHPSAGGAVYFLHAGYSGNWSPLLGYDRRCGWAKYD